MSNNIKLGKEAEDLACKHLLALGYTILERNWRFSKAEIDIIARNEQNILVFVEVKSKSYDFYGKPEESVNQLKQNLVIDAAFQYMKQINYSWEVRFDIISILFDKKEGFKLQHFEDAFF